MDLETNRKIVGYNLAILINLPELSDILASDIITLSGQLPALTTFLDSAIVNRYEIKVLAINGKVADINIKSIKADALPHVLLGVNAYCINPRGPFLPVIDGFVAPLTAGAIVA